MMHPFTLACDGLLDFWALLSMSCRFLDGVGIGALLCLAS